MRVGAFRDGLRTTGYVEGQNLTIEYRWAEGRFDRLPALAADLVGRKVDLIATAVGYPAARAAQQATSTTPIVFCVGVDPVATGLVESMARPSGNMTGFAVFGTDLWPKRLELIAELGSRPGVIATLVNPNNTGGTDPADLTDLYAGVARGRGLQHHILWAGSEAEIDTAFATLAELHAGALVIGADPFLNTQRAQIAALATRYSVPAIFPYGEGPAAGGLISYGPSFSAIHHEQGIYAGRILKGTRPSGLPVQQPSKFELIINLKTAKALGLTFPPALLARADEVIE
jgi:putative tryptophan/tyrosine transport system substrate-binding protein